MGYEYTSRSASNELFKTLADPTRRAIFEQLMRHGEQNVRALTDRAQVSQPAVSKHLHILKQAGLVHERPSGRTVHYSANPQGLAPLLDWLGFYAVFWKDRFEQLEQLLEGLDK
jgi:DNA-binding transcriptional ArsR family regulator